MVDFLPLGEHLAAILVVSRIYPGKLACGSALDGRKGAGQFIAGDDWLAACSGGDVLGTAVRRRRAAGWDGVLSVGRHGPPLVGSLSSELPAHRPAAEDLPVTPWYEIENASEVASPALLIYPQRVEENLRRMIALSGGTEGLRPHVKTHKLPQIVALKLQAGIDKFKASTIAEAEMTAAAGGRDILIAYQCVGPGAKRLARLIQTFPETRFAALVDNPATLDELSQAAVAAGVEMTLYLDLNVGMNRTGIELTDEAVALYGRMGQTPGVRVGGLHAYDGHLHNPDSVRLARDAAEVRDRVGVFLARLRDAGYEIPRLIAGGTPTSPLWAAHGRQELRDRHGLDLEVEVGAGTTVLWDFGQAAESTDQDFLNAAILLARVISRPTRDRICLDLGHKAVAPEMPQPRVRWFTLEDAEPVLQNEEHLVLKTERAADYPVGTVLYGIPRHICPTVALQSEVVCVRDARAVENWPVVARARRITL